ncbi:MAG: hypothetical protein FD149_1314 [Rhodospirillaceae bacterium]|nr:MAG: hypothetical protein FD149_1314 [Rhodospirillaceae bacterium]
MDADLESAIASQRINGGRRVSRKEGRRNSGIGAKAGAVLYRPVRRPIDVECDGPRDHHVVPRTVSTIRPCVASSR